LFLGAPSEIVSGVKVGSERGPQSLHLTQSTIENPIASPNSTDDCQAISGRLLSSSAADTRCSQMSRQ
jgi:hypothetical protein